MNQRMSALLSSESGVISCESMIVLSFADYHKFASVIIGVFSYRT